MNRVVIVGAGNLGREVMDWALSIPRQWRDWELGGFLDSRADILDSYPVPYSILGDPQSFSFQKHDRVACAIGDSRQRLRYCRMLESRNIAFATIMHPSVIVGTGVTIGKGCILNPNTVLGSFASLADYVLVNTASTVAHDASLGPGCTLSHHVDVTGGVQLGEGVFVGSHASILPKVKVGAFAIVGAGAVVTRDVAPDTTVAGVPAKELRSPLE